MVTGTIISKHQKHTEEDLTQKEILLLLFLPASKGWIRAKPKRYKSQCRAVGNVKVGLGRSKFKSILRQGSSVSDSGLVTHILCPSYFRRLLLYRKTGGENITHFWRIYHCEI